MKPRKVLEQEELANKLFAKANGKTETPPSDNEDKNQPIPEPDEPTPQPNDDHDHNLEKENDPEYWKRRFKTVEGMYKSQNRELRDQLTALTNEVTKLREENFALQQAVKSGGQQQQPGSNGVSSSVSVDDVLNVLNEEEREDYGDLVGVIAKVASSVANKIAGEKLEKVAPKLEHIEQTTQQTAYQNYLKSLEKAVEEKGGNVYEINSDPEFHAFLAEIEPYSGLPRQKLLERAEAELDSERCARFFLDFLKLKGRAQQQTKRDLESRMLPQNEGGNMQQTRGGKKIWTTAEIEQFYADVRSGRYIGRESEMAAIERDIFLANQEGRVR